jgi:hypothetical protein
MRYNDKKDRQKDVEMRKLRMDIQKAKTKTRLSRTYLVRLQDIHRDWLEDVDDDSLFAVHNIKVQFSEKKKTMDLKAPLL